MLPGRYTGKSSTSWDSRNANPLPRTPTPARAEALAPRSGIRGYGRLRAAWRRLRPPWPCQDCSRFFFPRAKKKKVARPSWPGIYQIPPIPPKKGGGNCSRQGHPCPCLSETPPKGGGIQGENLVDTSQSHFRTVSWLTSNSLAICRKLIPLALKILAVARSRSFSTLTPRPV